MIPHLEHEKSGNARAIPRHPGTAYLLCASPRTGSTLLAEGLAGTGIAGRPLEYFDIHQHNEKWWVEHLGIADDFQYLGKVLHAAATDNGIVGIKVHWHQFSVLHAKVASAAARRAPLSDVFPNLKHIWLTRANKIAQAISYYRASKTDLWHKRPIGALNPPRAADAQFDYREIDRLVALIHHFDASWSRYFAAMGVTPLRIVYEDMVADFAGTIRAVLRHMAPMRKVSRYRRRHCSGKRTPHRKRGNANTVQSATCCPERERNTARRWARAAIGCTQRKCRRQQPRRQARPTKRPRGKLLPMRSTHRTSCRSSWRRGSGHGCSRRHSVSPIVAFLC
jgi:trehalose 2-sulfotransferase